MKRVLTRVARKLVPSRRVDVFVYHPEEAKILLVRYEGEKDWRLPQDKQEDGEYPRRTASRLAKEGLGIDLLHPFVFFDRRQSLNMGLVRTTVVVAPVATQDIVHNGTFAEHCWVGKEAVIYDHKVDSLAKYVAGHYQNNKQAQLSEDHL